MSEVLGAFGLLDFTILRPVLAWRAFETDEPFIHLSFFFALAEVNSEYRMSGYGRKTVQ
jgi:hypothetical protein